jgi:hypothetical protein
MEEQISSEQSYFWYFEEAYFDFDLKNLKKNSGLRGYLKVIRLRLGRL